MCRFISQRARYGLFLYHPGALFHNFAPQNYFTGTRRQPCSYRLIHKAGTTPSSV